MSAETVILLSGTLTFGVPLALAARELWALRREGGRGRDGGRGGPDGPAPDVPPAPRPAGGRPLPDCLIPKPLPAAPPVRVRDIEHV